MDKIFDRDFTSKTIYGLIMVIAVLLVMEGHPPSAWIAAATVFGTVLGVVIAEAYSATIAEIIAGKKKLSRQEINAIWRHTSPIFLVANIPTLIIILAGLEFYSVDAALKVARYTIYIVLFLYGLQIGRLLHASIWRILLSGFFTAGIGILIGLMKILLH